MRFICLDNIVLYIINKNYFCKIKYEKGQKQKKNNKKLRKNKFLFFSNSNTN